MLEVKSKFHVTRFNADRTHWMDLIRPVIYSGYVGDPQKIPAYFGVSVEHSAKTDLRKDIETIVSTFHKDVRKKIKKAERLGCVFEVEKNMDEYVAFQNELCDAKGLDARISREKLRKYKHVLITKVSLNGKTLAMKCAIFDDDTKTAISLYSSTCRFDVDIDPQVVSRANRYLRLKELELLKDMGYETYDWGGICTDPNDPRNSIAEFKLSFGGEVFENRTLKSPIYMLLESIRAIVKKILKR